MVNLVTMRPKTEGNDLTVYIRIMLTKGNADVEEAIDRVSGCNDKPRGKKDIYVNNKDILALAIHDFDKNAKSKKLAWGTFQLSTKAEWRGYSYLSALNGLQAGHSYSLTIQHPSEFNEAIRLTFK